MQAHCPSRTAQRVALRRAAHQLLDTPKIFEDPLALPLVGLSPEAQIDPTQDWLSQEPLSRVLRASLAARSRFADEALIAAINHGIRQVVILGAGLDTFAYRHAADLTRIRVFEVDHPATQDWKRGRLACARIPIPGTLSFVPMDFERSSLREGLALAGFDFQQNALFSWLGVSMYLSETAVHRTLALVAELPVDSGIVLDYMIPPDSLGEKGRRIFAALARRVAASGEPFRSFFAPAQLAAKLQAMGLNAIEDLGPEQLDGRYCAGRRDGLRVGRLGHVVLARKTR